MDAIIRAGLDSTWLAATEPRQLSTPDDRLGRLFTVSTSTVDTITVITEGGSEITLERAAFHATLRYLLLNSHGPENPCEIRSNNGYEEAGPLCRASRDFNGRTRVINYVIAILADIGIVSTNGAQPNSTWLV